MLLLNYFIVELIQTDFLLLFDHVLCCDDK